MNKSKKLNILKSMARAKKKIKESETSHEQISKKSALQKQGLESGEKD